MQKHENPLANVTFPEKVRILREVFSDWPTVFLDQYGWVRHLQCHTRPGPVFSCRGGGADAGRVAVIFSGRAYPPEVLRFEAFPEDATVWDVGADIGAFSLWIHGWLRKTHVKRVSFVCVEPVDESLDLLQENLALNGLAGAFVFDGRVGSMDTQPFADAHEQAHAQPVASKAMAGRVRQSTLESLFALSKSRRIDLLRMNLGDSTLAVLESSKAFILDHVDRLLVEHPGCGRDPAASLPGLLAEAFAIAVLSDDVLFLKSHRLVE